MEGSYITDVFSDKSREERENAIQQIQNLATIVSLLSQLSDKYLREVALDKCAELLDGKRCKHFFQPYCLCCGKPLRRVFEFDTLPQNGALYCRFCETEMKYSVELNFLCGAVLCVFFANDSNNKMNFKRTANHFLEK